MVTPPWGALRQCWLQDPQEGEGVGPERSLQLGEARPWATGLQAPGRQEGWAGALGQRWTTAQTDVWQGREASRGLPGPRDVRGLQGSRPPAPTPGTQGCGTWAWPCPWACRPSLYPDDQLQTRDRREEGQWPLTPPLPSLCALLPPGPFPHSVPPGSHRHKGCRGVATTLHGERPRPAGSEAAGGAAVGALEGDGSGAAGVGFRAVLRPQGQWDPPAGFGRD